MTTRKDEKLARQLALLEGSNLSKAGKERIRQQLLAEANPDSNQPDVQLAQLPEAMREAIVKSTEAMRKAEKGRLKAARQALRDMPDSEWERLVNEANQEGGGNDG